MHLDLYQNYPYSNFNNSKRPYKHNVYCVLFLIYLSTSITIAGGLAVRYDLKVAPGSIFNKKSDWPSKHPYDLATKFEPSVVIRLSGGLGQAFGTLAGTTSDIGRLQQALGQADISQLTQLGALRQRQQQAELDANRANLLQQAQEPFTRLQLGQNLLQGMPSASIPSTFTQATQPAANPFLQGIGAYTTLSQIAPFSGGPTANRG